MEDEQDESEPDNDPQLFEHPDLESEPRFWDGKWAEVKRRFVKMAWEDEQSRMAIILGCAGILVGILWTLLFE